MGILVIPTPIFSIGQSVSNTANNSTPVQVANYIVGLLIALAVPIAVAAILYSAYILITGGGDPAAYTKVKKNLLYILTGLAIIVFSAIIFNAFVGFFLN